MKPNPARLVGADSMRTCWRVAAIYRCCLHYGASEAWARERLAEIFPHRPVEEIVHNWFVDMPALRRRYSLRLSTKANFMQAAA